MAAKPVYLELNQVKDLVQKHRNSPFCVRDAALIGFSGLAYLSLVDLSLIRVKDVVSESGQIYKQTVIPREYNPNGKEKLLVIPNKSLLLELTEELIEWRKSRNFGVSNLGTYCGLNPESKLFVRDDGESFELSPRVKGVKDTVNMQPAMLRRHFDRFVLGLGVNHQSLNRSFLLNFYGESIRDGKPSKTIKSLVALTGLGVDTIRKQVNREPRSIREVLSDIY
ncbi:MAG: hypothetical protein C9356_20340 [Oleiphilus sp.]|nr:MAG: hypothetical protein C9356_20340 [Oleiphilus sp.]